MKIDEAEKEINKILLQLEVDEGQSVDCVGIVDVDTTQVKDNGRRVLRTARIVMVPTLYFQWLI